MNLKEEFSTSVERNQEQIAGSTAKTFLSSLKDDLDKKFQMIRHAIESRPLNIAQSKDLLKRSMLEGYPGYNATADQIKELRANLHLFKLVEKLKRNPDKIKSILVKAKTEGNFNQDFINKLEVYGKSFNTGDGTNALLAAYNHFEIKGSKWEHKFDYERDEILRSFSLSISLPNNFEVVNRNQLMLVQFESVKVVALEERKLEAESKLSEGLRIYEQLTKELQVEQDRIKSMNSTLVESISTGKEKTKSKTIF